MRPYRLAVCSRGVLNAPLTLPIDNPLISNSGNAVMAGTTIFISQDVSWHSVEILYGEATIVVELDAWWRELWHDQNVVLRSSNDNFRRPLSNPNLGDVALPPS